MNYVLLVKTKIDNNIKHNSIEKIPYKGKISLESMYKLCECELIDIKDIPLQLVEFDNELGIIPAVTLIFDEEFLLKNQKPIANEIASVIFGYDRMHDQCLCGNVLLCYTNEEGDCMPFSESETNGIIKCLKRINEHIFEYEEQIKRRNQKINTLREKLLMPVNCYPYRSI